MALDTIPDRANGQITDEDWFNILKRVLAGDFVGRAASGTPSPNQNLGTPSIPWGVGRFSDLILGGVPVDPGLITAQPNRVTAGAVRASSEFPDYLRPDGAAASFTILGATTQLTIDVNGTLANITADIVKSSLTPATGHGINDVCRIADASLSGQDNTRFLGENRTSITVDLMGSELTAKIGEFVALLNQTTSEILYCRIASATKLDYARRGFWFDSSGNPIEADPLTNIQFFQLMSLAFIFAEDDGVTIDVTYDSPAVGGNEPGSPATGDYWYDLTANVWKRYSGSAFVQIDRTFIGTAVIDPANCIGTRPEYFSKVYRPDNTLSVRRSTVDIIISSTPDFLVSVDGSDKRFDFGFFAWDAATDFESGVARTVSRDYWLYITEDGTPQISDKKPYETLGFLRGWYHPYNSWRAVAQIFNNASDEFEVLSPSDETLISTTGPLIPALHDRIILSNGVDALHDIDTTAGKFTTDDDKFQFIAPALTKRLDANWTQGSGGGGSPGIALGANATYHYFILTNDDGSIVDAGMDTALSASALLAYASVVTAGLTKASYQGSLRTDSASNIRGFRQYNKDFILDDAILFDNGIFSATTPLDTNAPFGITTKARIAFWLIGPANFNFNWTLGSPWQTGYDEFYAGSLNKKTVNIYTDTSSQVALIKTGSLNITSSEFYLLGWEDTNLKG